MKLPAATGVPDDASRVAALDRLARDLDVDTRRGVAVLCGRTDRYIDMLRQLVEEHAKDMRILLLCMDQGDLPGAIRIAHSLKGAAATLCARRLSERARDVERLLREHPLPDPEKLARACEAIDHEMMAIDALLPALPQTQAPPEPAAPADEALLDALAEKLSVGDFSAAELFETNAAAFVSALGPAGPALTRAMARFDFPAALEQLKAARTGG